MSGLIVYGASCVWWDSINKAAKLENGLPCCPHCKGVLFQINEEEWEELINKCDKKYKSYRQFIEWLKGKCLPTYLVARRMFKAQHMVLDLDVLKWLDED